MSIKPKNSRWQLRPAGTSSTIILSCNHNGINKFTENPNQPEAELAQSLADRLNTISVLVTPPCSPQTLLWATGKIPQLKKVIIADYQPDRLATWQAEAFQTSRIDLEIISLPNLQADGQRKLETALLEMNIDLALGKAAVYFPARFKRLDNDFAVFLEQSVLHIQQQACSNAAHETTRNWHKTVNKLLNIQQPTFSAKTAATTTPLPPVVIVGAGPSLTQTAPVLKQHQDNVIIIATDASLNALFQHQITPDIICSMEDVMSWQFFAGNRKYLNTIPLVIPAGGNHIAVRHYPGPLIFSHEATEATWSHSFDQHLLTLDHGLCVGHMALALAQSLTPSMIIMTGFDLAYTNGQTHAAGTAVEVDQSFREKEQEIMVPGSDGKALATTQSFYFYINYFQQMLAKSPIPVINATEGGALLDGADNQPLSQALAPYQQPVEITIFEQKQSLFQTAQTILSALQEALPDLQQQLQAILSQADQLTANNISNPLSTLPLESPVFNLLSQCSSTLLMADFYDVSSNYTPKLFPQFQQTLEALVKDLLAGSELIETVLEFREFQPDLSSVLLLQPETAPDQWEKLIAATGLTPAHVLPATSSLPTILSAIHRHQISTLLAVDGAVLPDCWSIPDISCFDIKTTFTPHSYERFLWIPSYTILCATNADLKKWQQFCPDNIPSRLLEA